MNNIEVLFNKEVLEKTEMPSYKTPAESLNQKDVTVTPTESLTTTQTEMEADKNGWTIEPVMINKEQVWCTADLALEFPEQGIIRKAIRMINELASSGAIKRGEPEWSTIRFYRRALYNKLGELEKERNAAKNKPRVYEVPVDDLVK